MADESKRAAAFQAFEVAIAQLSDYIAETPGEMLSVDAVLIIGVQSYDDEGDRVGGVNIFPRHGCQPVYITTGLLEAAKLLITHENMQ
jgi:hypothetical protein